jgi:electron transport complex protein RnfD
MTPVGIVMLRVVLALIPGAALYAWLFGWGVIFNIALCVATAYVSEAAMLALRKRPVVMFLSDNSALVTGLLLGLALPPLAPWWLPVLGTAFAMVFAKHIYGGLGFNPFNPAMIGYVVLLVSFPREMTSWAAPLTTDHQALNFTQTMTLVFSGALPHGLHIDALTAATPLDTLKTQLHLKHSVDQVLNTSPIFGALGGKGWEWVNLAFLGGGLWLMYKKIISWHVPVAVLGSLALIALVFFILDPKLYASPLFHVASGAAILGAFFIATDPVSGAASPKGRLVFGAGVGLLTYIIRTWGGYPDALAFAVLLMNMAAPTIDYYTRPRVFGHPE